MIDSLDFNMPRWSLHKIIAKIRVIRAKHLKLPRIRERYHIEPFTDKTFRAWGLPPDSTFDQKFSLYLKLADTVCDCMGDPSLTPSQEVEMLGAFFSMREGIMEIHNMAPNPRQYRGCYA